MAGAVTFHPQAVLPGVTALLRVCVVYYIQLAACVFAAAYNLLYKSTGGAAFKRLTRPYTFGRFLVSVGILLSLRYPFFAIRIVSERIETFSASPRHEFVVLTPSIQPNSCHPSEIHTLHTVAISRFKLLV